MFERHSNFVVPIALVKQLYKSKNKKDNNKLVHVIKSGLSDLKDEIKKIPENEIQTEKPDKIWKIVEEILIFNRENRE